MDNRDKKILEWCGFDWHDTQINPEPDLKYLDSHWVNPKGHREFGDITIDPNFLSKYIIHKLDYIEIKAASKGPFFVVKILHENNEYFGTGTDLAKAIKKTLKKLIDGIYSTNAD